MVCIVRLNSDSNCCAQARFYRKTRQYGVRTLTGSYKDRSVRLRVACYIGIVTIKYFIFQKCLPHGYAQAAQVEYVIPQKLVLTAVQNNQLSRSC